MTKTGPQKYPGASQTYRYQNTFGGDSMESNVIVWHSTEGTSLPSYSGGSEAPNFTAKPDFSAKRLVWYQHFDFDTSARALVNAPGGVETNTLNVCQVEIVGTCDPTTHKKWGSTAHLYMPELPDWAIRDLAAFAKWANANHGVPLTSGVTFKAYPASYASGAGVRMSASKWSSFKGHCGHQHVPENVHGDPGAFPMAAILTAAKGGTPIEEDPMAGITKQDIFAAVWSTDAVAGPVDAADHKTNPTWQPQSILKDVQARVRALDTRTAAMSAAITSLAGQLGKDVDTATVVAAVEQAIAAAVVKVNVDVTGA